MVQACGGGSETGILITVDDAPAVPLRHSVSRLSKLFGQFNHLHAEPLDPDKVAYLSCPDKLRISSAAVEVVETTFLESTHGSGHLYLRARLHKCAKRCLERLCGYE